MAGTDPLVLLPQHSPVIIDTDDGSILSLGLLDLGTDGIVYSRLPQGAGLPDLGVFAASEIRVSEGVEVRVVGSAALVLVSATTIRISGTIDATGGIELAGPGGFNGGVPNAANGLGPGGGPGEAGGTDLGGAGAGHLATGGKGGDRQDVPGPAGGSPYGVAGLEPLIGGSGGGFGGGNGGGADGGRGGGGGGAVQMSAVEAIRIDASGVINVGGGAGEGGDDNDCGGGAGSGGAILLEAPSIRLEGVLAANGGSGGAGADDNDRGSPGLNGPAAQTAAPGGTGIGEGGNGGTGGASGNPAGGPGEDADLAIVDHGGGGGGAAGRIRLRADALAELSPIVTPVEGTTTSGL